ncbi:hypothetical protein [Hoylesella timonensis]|uniref:hypothetical protein n=1 Tax=Hoylesella timonensis TaxID=386414 RepID=UPI00288BAC2E|nr:hypothetical protein [Hoylesella timonensis]
MSDFILSVWKECTQRQGFAGLVSPRSILLKWHIAPCSSPEKVVLIFERSLVSTFCKDNTHSVDLQTKFHLFTYKNELKQKSKLVWVYSLSEMYEELLNFNDDLVEASVAFCLIILPKIDHLKSSK